MKIWGIEVDIEDLEQESNLAYLEAKRDGTDPELAIKKARYNYVAKQYKIRQKEIPYSVLWDHVHYSWISEARKVIALTEPTNMTVGQRKRFLRNRLIMIGTLAGMSQRDLAIATGLPHSRIAAIIGEVTLAFSRCGTSSRIFP